MTAGIIFFSCWFIDSVDLKKLMDYMLLSNNQIEYYNTNSSMNTHAQTVVNDRQGLGERELESITSDMSQSLQTPPFLYLKQSANLVRNINVEGT